MFLLNAAKRSQFCPLVSRYCCKTVHKDGAVTNEPDSLYREIVLTVRGHEGEVLNSYRAFLATVCKHFDLDLNVTVRNKPYIERLVLNSCPFIHKKTFREYEIKTEEHKYRVPRVTGCTASVFLEYVQRNLPEGVSMTVEKHRLEALPEHLLKTVNAAGLSEPSS